VGWNLESNVSVAEAWERKAREAVKTEWKNDLTIKYVNKQMFKGGEDGKPGEQKKRKPDAGRLRIRNRMGKRE